VRATEQSKVNMAENLSSEYPVVQTESFSTEDKERWAANMKILLQKRKIVLPADRDLVAQTHSIKRKVLPSGRVSFDAEKRRSGHADRFWAVAMACQKERNVGGGTATVTVRILG
jgi:phage FluMu gp28-like protein